MIRFLLLLFVIAAALVIAGTVSDLVLMLGRLDGPAALVGGMVVFAVVFFIVLRLVGRYTGIRIFGFDRD